MLGYAKKQKSLTGKQKEALGLLSLGTFLEYFDLMLYVHMTVLLNELFFPKSNPYTTSLLSAFSFCSTFIFRPFGALIFGWLGDNIGRKSTIVITTFLMALSCVLMANVPTYQQIGLPAAILVTICRIIQGISSMGEVTGANIYMTEITQPPIQYPAVATIGIFGALGGFAALATASLFTFYDFNWRYAFWFGAIVAIVGGFARKTLRETPEFADAKRRVKQSLESINQSIDLLEENIFYNQKINKITALSLFVVECTWPVVFYLAYFYFSKILQDTFNYSPEDVIHQNFILSIVQFFSFFVWSYLSYYIYPIFIINFRLIIFIPFIIVCPWLLYNISSPYELMAIQIFTVAFGFMGLPAMPAFYRHLPIFKRFTYASFMYALSRAVIYIITTFGLVSLTNHLGHWGILIIVMPIGIGFVFALKHFVNLEKEANYYPQKVGEKLILEQG